MSYKNFFFTFALFLHSIIFTNCQTLLTSIQIKVDLSSVVSYSNYECGGPLLVGDSTVYPPCISFKDAGIRARQYLSGSISIPNDNSLYISILNAATAPIVTGDASQLGNLFGFCTVDLSGAAVATRIRLDGTSATGSFLSLIAPTIPNTSYQCSSGTTVKIRYLNFIDWGNQNIFYSNVNQIAGPTTKTAFGFLFCIVSHASSIINIQPKGLTYDKGAFTLTVNGCTFSDIYSGPSIGVGSTVIPPLNLLGVMYTSQSTGFINSTFNASPIIYVDKGSFEMKGNCLADHVNVGNSFPLIKAVDLENNFWFDTVSVSNCVLSTFFHSSNSIAGIPIAEPPNNIANFYMNDNTLITSASGLPNSFFYIQSYHHSSVTISNIPMVNNLVASGKPLVWFENVKAFTSDLIISPSFANGIYALGSNLNISYSEMHSVIPFSGDYSIINIVWTTISNSLNYGYCTHCTITVSGSIVYDTL